MDLLKQTSVILGLMSLVIGGWAIYRHWRNKITLLFSLFCFMVSIWAFSFVTHSTIAGRLSYDIHLFFNVWIVPIAISLLYRIMFKKKNLFSEVLKWASFIGAVAIGFWIAFSFPRTSWFNEILFFYPTLISVQFFYGMFEDLVLRRPMNTDFISAGKKTVFYLGLTVSLATCTFDHIPQYGYTIPSIGNLLLTVYLVFTSQVISPQKLLKLEALISRFLAVLILALIITGFFALLYPYISETFGLLLLNSFLIVFVALSLWSPLVTLFRYLGIQVFHSKQDKLDQQIADFKHSLSVLTEADKIRELTIQSISRWTRGGVVTLVEDPRGLIIPENVKAYFETSRARKVAPVLHREILMMERNQAMVESQRQSLNWLVQFLETQGADVVIPSYNQDSLVLLTRLHMDTPFAELSVSLSLYGVLYEVLQDVGVALVRLTRVAEEREKDRLILLGEMAAGLAHEVRNPLGAIRGAADLIPDTTSPWAIVIQEEVSRLNRLVSQFLDFAQDPKEQLEDIDLYDVAQVTVQGLKLSMPAQIDLSLMSDGPAPVVAVPDHVRQVLINLIQNAIKATEGRENPQIEIRVSPLQISIKDNGVGMSKEVKEKIFQPFFTSFKKGTGLGLSICQRLVSFNGGSIRVLSEEGKGTDVIVSFVESKTHA
jgi:two-component system sensor histidine kinase HydH